jgi:hypothetical protein
MEATCSSETFGLLSTVYTALYLRRYSLSLVNEANDVKSGRNLIHYMDLSPEFKCFPLDSVAVLQSSLRLTGGRFRLVKRQRREIQGFRLPLQIIIF